MANEITATATLTVTKSGQTTTGTISKSITLAGSKQWVNTQVIGTSAEQLSFPSDLTTEGLTYLWLYNADSTNYVEIALDSGMTQIFCKLLAGQPAMIRAYTGNPTYYARANTAEIDLRMVAVGT